MFALRTPVKVGRYFSKTISYWAHKWQGLWETLPEESGTTFEDKYRITNQIFGCKYKNRNFDDFKDCWLYLQDIPKFGDYAMKHHETTKPKGKRKSSDGADFERNDEDGGSQSDKDKENARPIGTKKARRLQEKEEFIKHTTAALDFLNNQNFGLFPHCQQTMADFVEAMNQNMVLQQMEGADPSVVEAYRTELAKVNLRKLQ